MRPYCDTYGNLDGVARKQVLVQLDDELVEGLDRLAEEEGVSRSELIRRAARVLIQQADWAEADRKMIEAYRRQPQEPWIGELGTQLAAELDLGPPPPEQ